MDKLDCEKCLSPLGNEAKVKCYHTQCPSWVHVRCTTLRKYSCDACDLGRRQVDNPLSGNLQGQQNQEPPLATLKTGQKRSKKPGGNKRDEDKVNNKKLKLAEKKEIANKIFKKNIEKTTNSELGYSEYHCKICDNFETISELEAQKHAGKHEKKEKRSLSKRRIYSCSMCDEKFINKPKFNKHWKTTHAPDECCFCTLCGREFKSKTNLSVHLKLVHIADRPFQCSICLKMFKRQCYVREHEIRMHGQLLFNCEQCPKSFSSKNLLSKHVNRTHENNYICDCCGRSWPTTFHLKRHLNCNKKVKKNNIIICNYCDKTFSTVDNLNRHVSSVHLKKNNYVCDVCSKNFGSKFNLQRHKKTHQSSSVKNVRLVPNFDINDYELCSDYGNDLSDDNSGNGNAKIDSIDEDSKSDSCDDNSRSDKENNSNDKAFIRDTKVKDCNDNVDDNSDRNLNTDNADKDSSQKFSSREFCLEILELLIDETVNKNNVVDKFLYSDELMTSDGIVKIDECEFITLHSNGNEEILIKNIEKNCAEEPEKVQFNLTFECRKMKSDVTNDFGDDKFDMIDESDLTNEFKNVPSYDRDESDISTESENVQSDVKVSEQLKKELSDLKETQESENVQSELDLIQNQYTNFLATNCDNELLECKQCLKAFSSPSYLLKHMKSMHFEMFNKSENENSNYELSFPHKCDICSKRFTKKQNLTRHQKLHTVDPNFSPQCRKCKKLFVNKASLYDHFPCKVTCNYCDYETHKLSHLELHMKRKHST